MFTILHVNDEMLYCTYCDGTNYPAAMLSEVWSGETWAMVTVACCLPCVAELCYELFMVLEYFSDDFSKIGKIMLIL